MAVEEEFGHHGDELYAATAGVVSTASILQASEVHDNMLLWVHISGPAVNQSWAINVSRTHALWVFGGGYVRVLPAAELKQGDQWLWFRGGQTTAVDAAAFCTYSRTAPWVIFRP